MRGKKAIALLVCMIMVLGMLPQVALAVDNVYQINGMPLSWDAASSTWVSNETLYEINGVVNIPLNISNSSGTNSVISNVQITGSSTPVLTTISYPTDAITGNATISSNYLFIEAGVNPNAASTAHTVGITVYEAGRGAVKISFKVQKTTASSTTTPPPTDPDKPTTPEGLPSILMLAPLDASGQTVPTPSGDYGDRVTIRIPIFNRGGTGARATRILVTPVLSATLDSFPFDIEAVDYTRGLEEMRPGETREVQYNLRLSKEATAGVKEVKFNAVYFNSQKGAYETAAFSVFVNVVKGKTPPKTGAEGEEITTTPKVIIEGYTVTPEKQEDGETLYAGENFELTMRFRNTAGETVQNIQITMGNETGMILPANNGSNTLYIEKIGAGEMVERTVSLLTVPEAEPKSHKLSVKFGYESAKTLKSYEVTSDVSLSIKQRIRMRIDDPVMEPEVMAGSTVYAYFSIYNMGNSTVRNLMVDVEGEGLRMEETYYGGNMASGSSNSVDFGIRAETVGEIKGIVVITYEDAMGEVTRVEKPFTLNVMEAGGPDAMMEGVPIDPKTGLPMDGSIETTGRPGGKSAGLPLWAIILIAVVASGLVVAVLLFLRKRRRRKVLAGE